MPSPIDFHHFWSVLNVQATLSTVPKNTKSCEIKMASKLTLDEACLEFGSEYEDEISSSDTGNDSESSSEDPCCRTAAITSIDDQENDNGC